MKNHQVLAISGATSGMGKAVLDSVVHCDVAVAFSGRRYERIKQIESDYFIAGHTVAGKCSDVAAPGHYSGLENLAIKKFNHRPTAFVLCAGLGLPGTLLTSDAQLWPKLVNTNLLGAMYQLRDCAEHFSRQALNERRVRDIIVIGSTAGRTLSVANPIYGATKFALHSIVESLRQELCHKLIRVTLIEPGFVHTEFQSVANYNMRWFGDIEREQGPFLQAQDIASVIKFALDLPAHIHIDDFRIRPTRQRV